jgi:hypothetical protein
MTLNNRPNSFDYLPFQEYQKHHSSLNSVVNHHLIQHQINQLTDQWEVEHLVLFVHLIHPFSFLTEEDQDSNHKTQWNLHTLRCTTSHIHDVFD